MFFSRARNAVLHKRSSHFSLRTEYVMRNALAVHVVFAQRRVATIDIERYLFLLIDMLRVFHLARFQYVMRDYVLIFFFVPQTEQSC